MTATKAIYTPHPLRIQRKRTKGFKMPTGAIYVGRPTIWGNPFETAEEFRWFMKASQKEIVNSCDDPLAGLGMVMLRERIKKRLAELRGKQIACWCGLDCECHGDVLCDLANR